MVLAFTDASGNESIVTPGNPLPVGQGGSASTDPVKVTGTLGALNATLPIVVGQRDTMSMHVLGTFVGTIVLQGSGDGSTWVTLSGPTQWQNIATNTNVATITATGLYQTTVSALPFVRVLMSAYTSGSATVILEAVDGNAAVFLDSPIPAGTNTIGTVNLGAAGGQSLTAKASTTAPVSSDTSLVVTQSPNYVGASTAGLTANLAASTNAGVWKTSSGSLFQLDVSNYTGTAYYLKLYNLAAAPTVGTSVPTQVFLIGTGGTQTIEFGQYGKRFTTGIAYATTANVGDSDATAIVLTSGPAKLGVTYL